VPLVASITRGDGLSGLVAFAAALALHVEKAKIGLSEYQSILKFQILILRSNLFYTVVSICFVLVYM